MSTIDLTKGGPAPERGPDRHLAPLLGKAKPTTLDTTKRIRPEWQRDARTAYITVRLFLHRVLYRAKKHAYYSPVYLGLLLMFAPRGLARVVSTLARWLYDTDTATLRSQHVGAGDAGETTKAQAIRRANLKARAMVAVSALTVMLVPVLAWTAPTVLSAILAALAFLWTVKLIPGKEMWELGVAAGVAVGTFLVTPLLAARIPQPPLWVVLALAVLAVGALGWHGRNRDKAIVKPTDLKAGGIVEPIRAPVVTAALCVLGNSKMKEPDSIRLLMDVARHGAGYALDLELPPGVPASFVQKNREEFAAALRRELGTVWPGVGRRHPGHMTLFVSDQPMSEAAQEPWPLLRSGEVDLFKPFPAFTDQRGDWVPITLAYANMIIGAVPRMGKTFVLRQLLLAAGLDKRAKVYVFDGKGTGDLAPCALFAHCYVRGARLDRPEQIERVRAAVKELRKELGRRADVIDSLSHADCPESKVTSELAANRPDLDLGPIVFGLDETQALFGYGDDGNKDHKAIRMELKSGITELVKLGPALGIIVILATQQVKEETLPSSIAQNAVIRFCLKVEGHEPNDRVLGTGAYKKGIDAQMFDLDDKGIGYLKADGQVARIVRSVFGLDAIASESVAARGRAYREGAGLLTGDAAGEVAAEEALQVDLLADARDVMDNPPVTAMHLTELRDALADLRAGTWGHLDNPALGGMLRTAGVRVATVWSKTAGKDGKGVKREWLDVSTTEEMDDGDDEGGTVISLTR